MLLDSRVFAMEPAGVVIVLVRPRRAANVAAACRAMKNMGLASLRLVSPPSDLGAADTRASAYGAWDVLDGAEAYSDLAAAVSDASLVVGTSGRVQGAWTPRDLARRAREKAGPLAVVFGPEASGLTTEELRLCHGTVRIPSDPAHPSLNLAQAVLVVAYELFVARFEGAGATPPPAAGVTAGELEGVLAALRTALVPLGYLNPQNPEPILGELRALLVRAAPTPRELDLLRGLARQLAWAASRVVPADAGDA